jgi:hypothetical protein
MRRLVAGDVLCGGMAGGIATGTSNFFWFPPPNFCFCVVVWRAVLLPQALLLYYFPLLVLTTNFTGTFTTSSLHTY